MLLTMVLMLAVTVLAPAQTVLYQEKLDGTARGARPAGWIYTPGWMHCPVPAPAEDSVHDGIPESADWATTGNPEVDWQVVEIKRVGMYDANRGTDGIRDYWCTFTLDLFGDPIPDAPVSAIMPSTGLFYDIAPPADSAVSRMRAGGSTAPWVKAPYPNFGCDPVTGVVDENAKVLIADSDEYGGVVFNSAIVSPDVDLQGAKYARIEYKFMIEQNQDSETAAYYQIDNGPWQTLQRWSMHYHGDDFNYLADVSFVVNTEGGSKLRCLWYYQGNFSWEIVIDDFTVKGYNALPTDGPAQPQAVSPTGTIDAGQNVVLKASAYSGSKPNAFAQWQVREADGTYGQLVNYTNSSFLEAYPILDTGIQPNHYADGAYVWREGGIWSGALLRGQPNPATQLRVPIGDGYGPKEELTVPGDMLRPGVTYFWRVRYWDEDYKSSPWSDEQSFTVRAIPGVTLLKETFDGIQDPDKNDPADAAQIPTGWSGTFAASNGWDVYSLGVYQLFGNSPDSVMAVANGEIEPGSNSGNLIEPDGRGHHGRFKGNVLVYDSGNLVDAITPEINNTSSTQPLYLLFDAQIRSSKDSIILSVDMTDAAGKVTNVFAFQNVSADYADTVAGGRIHPVIYTISPAIRIDQAAGQRVRFTFYSAEDDGGDDYAALDNIEVIQYNPAVPVADWELHE